MMYCLGSRNTSDRLGKRLFQRHLLKRASRLALGKVIPIQALKQLPGLALGELLSTHQIAQRSYREFVAASRQAATKRVVVPVGPQAAARDFNPNAGIIRQQLAQGCVAEEAIIKSLEHEAAEIVKEFWQYVHDMLSRDTASIYDG